MKKASDYRHHAEECQRLARTVVNAEHKAALTRMAETWENLALVRAERLAREKRIAALEVPTNRD